MQDFEKFKELLDQTYTWPDYYTFKFIVKIQYREELMNHFVQAKCEEKLSQNGSYSSLSIRLLIQSSSEVIEIYRKVSTIPTLMSL
jgi:hypothetical protein